MKRFLIAAAASLIIFSGQSEASAIDSFDKPIETQDIGNGKWAHFRDKHILGRETENERRDRKEWERHQRERDKEWERRQRERDRERDRNRYRDDYRYVPPSPPRYRDGRRYYPPPAPPPAPYYKNGKRYYPPNPPPTRYR